MKLELIHKLLAGVFGLFLIFSAIVILVGDYQNDPLLSIAVFVVILYGVYYLAIKFLFKEL
ncbi:hypothetical protein [Caminibacter sp.]